MSKKIKKILRMLLLIALLITLLFGKNIYRAIAYEDISYNNFIKLLNSHKIKSAEYDADKYKFYAKDKNGNKYTVVNPQTNDFKKKLLEKNVDVKTTASISTFILSNISIIIYLGIAVLLVKSLSKSLPGKIGECKKENTGVKIDDIALPSSVKEEINLLVDYLNNNEEYIRKGVEIPNGVLLYGPPGTGKTMIAKAIASEANCNFYSISGSDFVELYVGNGARKVRELFKDARKNTPCIIFIDEIDAVGKRNSDNNSERDQTINALLNELDGFSESRDNILVIGATNRLDNIDNALIRAGRFGKHIAIPLPMTKEERMQIINIHKKDENFADDTDFEKLAKITTGFSGAEIASILNEAVLISIHEGKDKADNTCIDKAFCQLITKGHKKDKNEEKVEEKRLTAIHEAGHAIVAKLICNHSVPMVSIIATTSGAGGYTIALPEDDISYYSLEFLENQIKMLYAGRAAESVFGYSPSTGASNDIEKATTILKDMAIKYGILDGKMINYEKLYDGKIPDRIYEEITKKSEQLMTDTIIFLKSNIKLLTTLSEALTQKETIDEETLDRMIGEYTE